MHTRSALSDAAEMIIKLAPKYRDIIESGDEHIVPALLSRKASLRKMLTN